MSPKTLLYVKGGYTNARYGVLGSDGTTTLDQRIDLDGYRVGGGLEYAFSPKTFGRIEYRYSHYGKGEFDFGGQTPDSSRFNVDTDRHQIAVTYGLRF
jgi:outer membrane immunogenic protein